MDTVGNFGKVFEKICQQGSDKRALKVELTPSLTRTAEKGNIALYPKYLLKYKSIEKHKSSTGFVNGYTINFSDFFEEKNEHSLNLTLDEGIRFSFAFDKSSGLYLSKPEDWKHP